MIWKLITLFAGGPLDRILNSVDHNVDNATERERIKTQAVEKFIDGQVRVLTGRGWWFPLFFIAPLGLWFTAVCVYSIFFCAGCAFPQEWSIAALPAPLDSWAGVIVSSLFVFKGGERLIDRLRK